jgi:hypothetical protein
MIPWWWLIVACMLSGSFGAVIMALFAGAKEDNKIEECD